MVLEIDMLCKLSRSKKQQQLAAFEEQNTALKEENATKIPNEAQ